MSEAGGGKGLNKMESKLVMRTVKYTKHWAYAGRGQKAAGSLADLVLDIPYLMPWGVIPPLHVLNEYLLSGGDSGGMDPGTKWRPFQITNQEYAELVDYLVHLNTDEARTHHPYLYAKAIIVDEDFHQCPDHITWLQETSEKYRPLADWLKE
jgi:hypothetical protein